VISFGSCVLTARIIQSGPLDGGDVGNVYSPG
jgi:hypothetical protein